MDRQFAIFLPLCAVILLFALFVPGFIGMANNGDFPKVAGPLCMGGADNGADNFVYFEPDYLRGPKYCYDPKMPSSEIAVAWLASSLERIAGDPRRFDIRWIGALHAALFFAFYGAVLLLLRSLATVPRIVLSLAALWIFADIGTLAYFNSFYSDTAAILGGLMATMLAIHVAISRQRTWLALALFGAAALLFVTSKGQHGALGFVPAGFAAVLAWRARDLRTRTAAAVVAAAVAAASVWTVAATPAWYEAQARFNLIFFYLAKNSPNPARTLHELGLNDSDLRYVGMNSFVPGGPMDDPAYSQRFRARSTYGGVLRFYARNPSIALGELWRVMREEAWQRRPQNLSNFPRSYGRPAGARSERFASWSALRSRLFLLWPAHAIAWYALLLFSSPLLARRNKSPLRRALAWTIFALAFMGAAEFAIASLADACETYRHLLMFHVFTDATIFLAAVYAATPPYSGSAKVI